MTAKYTETAYAGNTILAIPQRMCRRHDIPMGYLDRLSEIRKRRGLTQMQIAEQVGVEQPTYQRWESGKRVVVVRQNDNGECEATVKELVEQDGDLWLVPRSHNPAHRPIRLSDVEPGIVETRIAAVVVASVRPE